MPAITATQTVHVIDLQNGVLLDDAEQQQQAKAGEDVDRLAGHQKREDAEWNCQRQRQQDQRSDG